MKCPKCGQEIMHGKVCDKCGNAPASSPGMDVEYKDFKVSELLDIKVRKRVPVGKEIPKAKAEVKQQTGRAPARKKRSWPMITVFSFTAALILFFLLKFLLKF